MVRKNIILLDASYVHTGGGEVLLNYFLETIFKQKNFQSYVFIFDKRYKIPYFLNIQNSKIFICRNSIERLILFLKVFLKFNPNSVFTINNLPPPFPLFKTRCFIYFHNVLLIQNPIFDNSIKSFLKFFLKKFYIKLLNFHRYTWVVQTNLVLILLKNELKIHNDKIIIIPFFREFARHVIIPDNNSFIYVSDGGKHKNHDFVLDTWLHFYKKYNYTPKLKLTFDEIKFPILASKVKRLQEIGLDISNFGNLKQEEIFRLYNESKYILFFSEYESFGLPLIEAAQLGKYIFTCKKDFVFQIIEPSESFDTKNIHKFVLYINDIISNNVKIKPAIIKVENKIFNLIYKIENNV